MRLNIILTLFYLYEHVFCFAFTYSMVSVGKYSCFIHFSFHLSFSLRLRRHFYPAAYADKALVGIYVNKKGMAFLRFPFHTACGDPQICFCPWQFYTSCGNKKSAKRLPCLCMVSSDTTYNLKQRMPRFSQKGAGTCRLARGLRTYRVCPACPRSPYTGVA